MANFFLYTNGCNAAHNSMFVPENDTSEAWATRREQAHVAQTKLNETYGKVAEENLLETLRLDNRNTVALSYLALLNWFWVSGFDPIGQIINPRLQEVRQCYTRVLEIDPEHRHAYYNRGALAFEMADAVVLPDMRPRSMPLSEEKRRSLHEQAGALLDQGFEDLSRSLELNPDDPLALTFLAQIKKLQARIELTEEKRSQAEQEAEQLIERTNSISKAHPHMFESDGIVFDRVSSLKEPVNAPQQRCFPPGLLDFLLRIPPPFPPPQPPKR